MSAVVGRRLSPIERFLRRRRGSTKAPRGPVQRLWNVCGVILTMLLLDFGVGWAWDASRHPTVVIDETHPVAIPIPVLDAPLKLPTATTEPPFQTGTVPPDDSRIATGPWADVPWAAEYFWGMNANERSAYPFLGSKPVPLRSPYFNVSGWERASYRPATTDGALVVWFFGGSTMFGMGQRDNHTIPSEIARIAEAEGTPVVVRNFGQGRWVNWQEVLLFEQLLATEPLPDLVVFYDGINDVDNQLIHPFDQPSEHQSTGIVDQTIPASPSPTIVPTTSPPVVVVDEPSLWSRVVDEYTRRSAVGKVWNAAFPEADAQNDRTEPKSEDEARALARRVADIYERGRNLATLMADQLDIETLFYWQPQGNPNNYWYRYATELIGAPTVDLTHVLDGQNVYYDTMHTLEPGAAMVAAAQWETLGPVVRDWYDEND